jgi:DNA helicase-2/ATP-dependent DNA helicase PcrA
VTYVNHPAYAQEKHHLQHTLERLDRTEKRLKNLAATLVKEANIAVRSEAMEANAKALEIAVEMKMEQLKKLPLIRQQCYFARLDFRENTSEESETIYLGRIGLTEIEEQVDVVIVDWREPIANLYYGGTEGLMAYEAPAGLIECEVYLKRQLDIEEDLIKRIVDTRLAEILSTGEGLPRDELLLHRLGQSSDRRLRDIVATIQKEQNQIIRAGVAKPLIVQGVAGSGKTTVALHRLAYLLYRYKDTLTPDDILIIAPNRIFLTYISEVLPSLGVTDASQTTLAEYLQIVYGKSLAVLPLAHKLAFFLENSENVYMEGVRDTLSRASMVKGSLSFLRILDRLVEVAGLAALPNKPFSLGNQELLSVGDLKGRFVQDYAMYPPEKRLEEVKRSLRRLADKHRDDALRAATERYEQLFSKARRSHGTGSRELLSLYKEREEALASISEKSQAELESYLNRFRSLDPLSLYRDLLCDQSLLEQIGQAYFSREDLHAVTRAAQQAFGRGAVEQEDLAPLAYLRFKLSGVSGKLQFKHLIIDEGQDLNPLEVAVLRAISGHDSFTIVGDVNQSIVPSKGIHDWKAFREGSFAGSQCSMAQLTLSYRTTTEIVEFANSIMQSRHFTGLAKAVERSGEVPSVTRCRSRDDLTQHIGQTLTTLLGDEMKNIAVITRTVDEARSLHAALTSLGHALALTITDADEYEGGLQVMPAHLTKGLEFDAVIVCNANEENYRDTELDAKLLYVSVTRAMHRLYVFYTGKITSLLAQVF